LIRQSRTASSSFLVIVGLLDTIFILHTRHAQIFS
jgi:hypothetical protein